MNRPCLVCGDVTDASHCDDCAADVRRQRDRRRGTRHDRGYDNRWQRLSARARRLQPWCTDCGTCQDLTADHLRWPARSLADVEVVCRACNSARGAVRGHGGHPSTDGSGTHGAGAQRVTHESGSQLEEG